MLSNDFMLRQTVCWAGFGRRSCYLKVTTSYKLLLFQKLHLFLKKVLVITTLNHSVFYIICAFTMLRIFAMK